MDQNEREAIFKRLLQIAAELAFVDLTRSQANALRSEKRSLELQLVREDLRIKNAGGDPPDDD